jgi:hypothetical protein
MADPSRDMILEAVHFLVEIGNPRHACLSGMRSIGSYGVTPRRPNNLAAVHPMSAYGTKRTSRQAEPMSAFGGKADIA